MANRKKKPAPRAMRSITNVKRSDKPDDSLVTPRVVARMLKVDLKVVRNHIEAGAPVGTDGSINLFHYTAWLIREIAGGDG